MLDAVRDALDAGRRLDRDQGRWLLTEAPLVDVGALAQQARFRRIPERRVTFVIDSNPNYTNVCITDCQFCAFYRKPGDPEAYTLTVEQVMDKIGFAAERGATTVLLQGGHNPGLPLDYYLSLVRETRRRFPSVTPHFFTASEIRTVADVSKLSVPEVLTALKEAGQNTLPGGGAEVLSERVRRRIEPKKGGPGAWLDVHREAHRRGFKSTATMMYGHVEEVVGGLDVAVHHGGGGLEAAPVGGAMHVEPRLRPALLGLDARAHALGQDLGAAPGNRALPGRPQAVQHVRHRQR